MTVGARSAVYVDGFNLYFGLKAKGWRHLYWYDIGLLAEQVVRPPSLVQVVHYFTARISGPEAKRLRQCLFLDANLASGKCVIQFGSYRAVELTCSSCGHVVHLPTEKKTDVNIAVQMLTDAFFDVFDRAILVSADADLVPAVEAVKVLFPSKGVIVGFPPGRFSKELAQIASGSFHISRVQLERSQLSDQITTAAGAILQRPARWRRSRGREELHEPHS